MTVSINGTSGIVNDATDLNYTGTLTGGTGVVNLGAGQVYKDASGKVGLGTSSMTRFFNLYDTTTNAQTAYFKSTQASGGAGFVAYNNGGEAATFQINGSSNTSYAGANSVNIGSITNNNLAFITNNTERARIDSSGNLLVGTTTSNFNFASGWNILINSGASYTNTAHANGTSSGAGYANFVYNSGIIGSITQNGTTAISYNTSSDYRLKEAIAPMTGALAKVALLKPCTYKWKVDGSDGQGFIAHELAEVEAGCVTGEKDAVDADGNPQYQGIDTSFLVATLTAAIQEQQTLITALTARITALEAPIV